MKQETILFNDLMIEWLNQKKEYVKESTYANYSTIVYNHLIPDFNNLPLNQMTHNNLQQYILEKIKTGRRKTKSALSQKFVKDIMVVLKNALRYAMNQDYLQQMDLEFNYPKSTYQKKSIFYQRENSEKLQIMY